MSEFDWTARKGTGSDIPKFFYSKDRPGQLQRPSGTGEKETNSELRFERRGAGEGLRDWAKQVLYFYGPETRKARPSSEVIPIGIEARFAGGIPVRWWPQASDLSGRTEESDSQLIWRKLELYQNLSEHASLTDNDLGREHWVNLARDVDADFISNGVESEKFVFYEGRTSELPAISIVPNPREGRSDPAFLLYNTSDFPIYDIFIIYRDSVSEVKWAGYYPRVYPLRPRSSDGTTKAPSEMVCPVIPDFDHLRKTERVSEMDFYRRTQFQLARLLTVEPFGLEGVYEGIRNPAQPQPATDDFRLFPREVIALEKTWNREFFSGEGLTILYRESVEHVDGALPLRIYTDAHHYVRLSRCSMVLNQHIDLKKLEATQQALASALKKLGDGGKAAAADFKGAVRQAFDRDRCGLLTTLAYYVKSGKNADVLGPVFDELRAGLVLRRPENKGELRR